MAQIKRKAPDDYVFHESFGKEDLLELVLSFLQDHLCKQGFEVVRMSEVKDSQDRNGNMVYPILGPNESFPLN